MLVMLINMSDILHLPTDISKVCLVTVSTCQSHDFSVVGAIFGTEFLAKMTCLTSEENKHYLKQDQDPYVLPNNPFVRLNNPYVHPNNPDILPNNPDVLPTKLLIPCKQAENQCCVF